MKVIIIIIRKEAKITREVDLGIKQLMEIIKIKKKRMMIR